MDAHRSPTDAETPPRQKRVLPLRSRRGGPGIGSCDVDIMILDMQKRKSENDPLIPIETQFLLTTDTSLVPPSSSSEPGPSRTAGALKVFQQPVPIQTPEFSLLSEDASVGGRFRPRDLEDSAIDTSDAVYEKRHRKYELFEKRQRLREKEKLKHEHYKLKERIEQLRGMEGAAFLSLPSSSFSPIPTRSNEEEDEEAVASVLGSPINGAPAHNEGERRRREMLDLALALEERYRILLPPDRKGADKDKKSNGNDGESIDNNGDATGDEEEDNSKSEVASEEMMASKSEGGKLRLKIKVPSRPASGLSTKWAKQRKSSSSMDPSSSTRNLALQATVPDVAGFFSSGPANIDESISHARPRKRRKGLDGTSGDYQYDASCESISAPTQTSTSRKSASGVSAKVERSVCYLMLAAQRNASDPKARKTQRHSTAFGVKIPPDLEEIREFSFPTWVLGGDDGDDAPSALVTSLLERLNIGPGDVSMHPPLEV